MSTFERNYYAKAIRGVRKILQGNPPVESSCDCSNCERERDYEFPAYVVIGCILLAGLMLVGGCLIGKHAVGL